MVARSSGKELSEDGTYRLNQSDYTIALMCEVFKKLPHEIRALHHDDKLLLASYISENKCGAEWETRRVYRMIDILSSAPHIKKGKSFKPEDVFPEQYRPKIVSNETRVKNNFDLLFAMAIDETADTETESKLTSHTALSLKK